MSEDEVFIGTPAWLLAVREFSQLAGFDVRSVLNAEDWTVVLVNRHPTVVVTANGMRALALLAPRPDAQEIAEQIISGMGGDR